MNKEEKGREMINIDEICYGKMAEEAIMLGDNFTAISPEAQKIALAAFKKRWRNQ